MTMNNDNDATTTLPALTLAQAHTDDHAQAGAVVLIEYWYDRHTRSWIVQRKDQAGCQIGEADYVGTEAHARHWLYDHAKTHGLKVRGRTASPAPLLLKPSIRKCAALGFTLRKVDGEYQLKLRGRLWSDGDGVYYTTSLADAVDTALGMQTTATAQDGAK